MEIKRLDRPQATRLRAASESQHDPGVYRIFQPDASGSELEVGWLDVQNSLFESWCIAQGAGLPPGVATFMAGGGGSSGTDRYRYSTRPLPIEQLIGTIPYSFHRIDVVVTVEPAHPGSVTPGNVVPNHPFLFQEGRYSLRQAGTKVGDLFIESTAASLRQHWFLYGSATPTTGVYTWPGRVHPNVTTTHQFDGAYATFDIPTFRATLPSSTAYLLGEESYYGTYPPHP